MAEFIYDVYISFSNEDTRFVTRLTDALRRSGCTTYSALDVLVGEHWATATQKALMLSRFVLVVLSSGYRISPLWVAECERALEREKAESRVVVLPALLDDSPLPFPLSGKVAMDFHEVDADPIFSGRVADLVRAIRRLSPSSPPSSGTRASAVVTAPALPPPVVPPI